MKYSTNAIYSVLMLVALAPLAATGCSTEPTDLTVRVCGDYAVPDDLEAVRIELLNEDREMLHSAVRDLVVCPEDRIRPLPQELTFRDIDEEVSLVKVMAISGGVAFARTERRVDAFGEFTITLSRDCRGANCALGQACISGQCEWTPTGSDEECLEPSGAPEVSSDAGDVDDVSPSPDTSSDDAGTTDEQSTYCPSDET